MTTGRTRNSRFWEIAKQIAKAASDEAGISDKIREYAYAVEVAKADPIEAMHGHYCGPGCLHVDLLLEPERATYMRRMGWTEWPSVVMERYKAEQKR